MLAPLLATKFALLFFFVVAVVVGWGFVSSWKSLWHSMGL